MDLDRLRGRIDAIDYEIVGLLRERMELAVRAGRLKESVSEPEREQKVFENVRNHSHGVVEPRFTEELYGRIIAESIRIQGLGLTLVGFQGEHGAHSEAAVLAFNPAALPIPCRDFPEVFQEVEAGRLDFAVVPVENSLEGAVTEVNDLLAKTSLRIAGEITLPIRHCLLALPGVRSEDLGVVYSHPQALAQCRGMILRLGLEARPYYDTAGASRMLSRRGLRSAAVIAGPLCAELYRLETVREQISDHDSNSTRFLVLSRKGATGGGEKCSMVFTVTHEPGALAAVMDIFSGAGINLTRIESRPLKNLPGRYQFFLDFEGDSEDRRIAEALEEVKKKTGKLNFLGCYKRG